VPRIKPLWFLLQLDNSVFMLYGLKTLFFKGNPQHTHTASHQNSVCCFSVSAAICYTVFECVVLDSSAFGSQ